jgi:hypothetical protein
LPGFGDAYFLSFLSGDEDVEITGDPLATDARLCDLEKRPEAEVMFVRVLWGNMRRGPDAADVQTERLVTDWTGSARISDGLLIPLRTIRFEPRDYLVPPWRQGDPSRQKVEWVSHTGPGRDGVLLKIVVPSASDTTLRAVRASTNGDGLTADDTFSFDTEPLQVSFPLETIADLDTLIMVDDTNGVSFVGFDRDDLSDICPRGYMAGAWIRVANDERSGGFFRAKWVGALGHLKGHVRGRWGVNSEGEKVFVGKIIGRNGSYLGHMRGNWEGNGAGQGLFAGRWEIHRPGQQERQLMGAVRGKWVVCDRLVHGGFLRGIWKANCNRSEEGDA